MGNVGHQVVLYDLQSIPHESNAPFIHHGVRLNLGAWWSHTRDESPGNALMHSRAAAKQRRGPFTLR